MKTLSRSDVEVTHFSLVNRSVNVSCTREHNVSCVLCDWFHCSYHCAMPHSVLCSHCLCGAEHKSPSGGQHISTGAEPTCRSPKSVAAFLQYVAECCEEKIQANGLDDLGSRVRFPAGAGNISLNHRVENGSGAHPASCIMGTRRSFPGGKAAGA
jgi:hypothetical protein